MTKHEYKIGSDEGAVFASGRLGYPVEPDAEVELELDHLDQEKALTAAGWLERVDEKKGKK